MQTQNRTVKIMCKTNRAMTHTSVSLCGLPMDAGSHSDYIDVFDVTGVPGDVDDEKVLQLFKQTAIPFPSRVGHTVPFDRCGYGRIIMRESGSTDQAS